MKVPISVKIERINKSYSLGDNTDKLTSSLNLLSNFDTLEPNNYLGSLPNLERLSVKDSPITSSVGSLLPNIEPGFDIDTFLNQLQLLDSRSPTPDQPSVPYSVARPASSFIDQADALDPLENHNQ